MAEPVSKAAWSRLVALLNVYVRDGGNSFSNAGPMWDPNKWTTEQCGLVISSDWSFPGRISRAMVKSMFEWSKDPDDLYRSFCAAMVWASERESRVQQRVKLTVASCDNALGHALLELKNDPTFANLSRSPLSTLGPFLGTTLLNALTKEEPRMAVIDQHALDWMWEYGQATGSWPTDLQSFSEQPYILYFNWCALVLDQFRNSGHLPDHCDDLAFIGYLMGTDRLQTQIGTRFSEWVRNVD